ncbi:unnamed protein product [Danaus chrysippus]|uniref:(African queen) hypothetical protein n=1 Tax=Danaus chrysippus TaxID=151541 RepID=A0A8J2W4E5_9NEOP|nr:unnamed protein product [Danaus chrysippus]
MDRTKRAKEIADEADTLTDFLHESDFRYYMKSFRSKLHASSTFPVVIPPRVRGPADQTPHSSPLSGRWPVRIGDLVLAVCKQKPPVVHTESPRSQAPELAPRSVYLYLAASAPPLPPARH